MLKKIAGARLLIALAAIAAIVSFAGLAGIAGRAQQATAQDVPAVIRARVTSVTDGDTISATVNGRRERIRLIGVNAPEIGRNAQPGGRQAHEFARRALRGKTVWLELDARERDRHGRLLAYVWLERPASATIAEVRARMFNAILLSEGHAETMTIHQNRRYADIFVAIQRERRLP